MTKPGTDLPAPGQPPTNPGDWPRWYQGPTLEHRFTLAYVWAWDGQRWLAGQLSGWWRDPNGWWGRLDPSSGGPGGYVPEWAVVERVVFGDEAELPAG